MERMLIVKIKRTEATRADLYAPRHRYPDLKLFDLAELESVGVDVDALPIGQEVPCKFYALWEHSEKTNQAGNPYKDVIGLEPIDRPATAGSVDNSAILAELRAIRALLQVFVGNTTGTTPAPDAQPAAEAPPDATPSGDEDDDLDAFFGPRPNVDPATHTRGQTEARNRPQPTDNGDNGNDDGPPPPTSPKALVAYLAGRGQHYAGAGELFHVLRAQMGDQFPTWPKADDIAGWQRVTAAADESDDDPEPPPNGNGRPLDAETIRATIRKKSGWDDGPRPTDREPLTEKQEHAVAGLMSTAVRRDGMKQADLDKARYDVMDYLLGVRSTKALTKAEASAIIAWLAAGVDDIRNIHEAARTEAARILDAVAVEAGQQPLFDDDGDDLPPM